jgi:hypothetical protein
MSFENSKTGNSRLLRVQHGLKTGNSRLHLSLKIFSVAGPHFLSNTETTKSVQTKADKINSINENEDHDEETAGDLNSINANEGTPGIAEEDD